MLRLLHYNYLFFATLLVIILPFPWFFMQTITEFISECLSALNATIIGDKNALIYSDSKGLYFMVVEVLFISTLLTILLVKYCQTSFLEKIKNGLEEFLRYFLILALLKYGLDKLLLHQFYSPPPNILFSKVGDLDKDMLFWTAMGTSKVYNYFMGLIEIIPAILLLFSRTKEIGGTIAFMVLLNVFMINVGFNVDVKFLSVFLMLLSIYFAFPLFKRIIGNTGVVEHKNSVELLAKQKLLLKSFVLFLLMLEVGLPYLQEETRLPFEGAFTEKSKDGIKRFHIHPSGFIILEKEENKMLDFQIRISKMGNKIIWDDYRKKETLELFFIQKQEHLQFYYFSDSSLFLDGERIDLNSMSLLRDETTFFTPS